MTFDGQYLTYNEYLNLGGVEMGEMPFNLLEFETRRQIDLRTHNRLKGQSNIPQEVKLCENEIINLIKNYKSMSTNESNVASVNTDGYSESYLTPKEIQEIINKSNSEIKNIIRIYLGEVIYNNEHLLYCGRTNANKH